MSGCGNPIKAVSSCPSVFDQFKDQIKTLCDMPEDGFDCNALVMHKGILYQSKTDGNKNHVDDSVRWMNHGDIVGVGIKLFGDMCNGGPISDTNTTYTFAITNPVDGDGVITITASGSDGSSTALDLPEPTPPYTENGTHLANPRFVPAGSDNLVYDVVSDSTEQVVGSINVTITHPAQTPPYWVTPQFTDLEDGRIQVQNYDNSGTPVGEPSIIGHDKTVDTWFDYSFENNEDGTVLIKKYDTGGNQVGSDIVVGHKKEGVADPLMFDSNGNITVDCNKFDCNDDTSLTNPSTDAPAETPVGSAVIVKVTDGVTNSPDKCSVSTTVKLPNGKIEESSLFVLDTSSAGNYVLTVTSTDTCGHTKSIQQIVKITESSQSSNGDSGLG